MMNTHTNAPRPSSSQVLGARVQLHAQNHPAGFALGGGLAAGAVTAVLALFSAAPALADPTGTPGWVLVAVLAAMLVAALVVGLLMYLHARRLPRTGEADPVRYASARVQAATGELGPDRATNDLARQLSGRFEYTSNPNYYLAPPFVVLVYISMRPLTEIIGPGFEPLMLLQLIPSIVLLAVISVVYHSAKKQHARFKAFRQSYDGADG